MKKKIVRVKLEFFMKKKNRKSKKQKYEDD